MRLLLVLMLVTGLVPGLGEVAETAVHLAVGGHLAHTAADQGDLGDLGDEHGCGTTEHHCSCCTSQALGLGVAGVVLPASAPAARLPGACRRLATLHEPAPPYRPPIAS
jgi:hypothetical protein